MTRSTRHRTARARRSSADRVRVRPRLEGLEDRCLLSVTITEFPVPTTSADPQRITAGPDGNLWFTETLANKIGEINPTTHAITEFPVPTANADPDWITAGPDGNLWFTENGVGQIGMINPTTHAITEFPVPTAGCLHRKGSRRAPTATSGSPRFWTSASKIGEINPTTHAITEFALLRPARPASMVPYVPIGDHGGPRRQPLVHRAERHEPDRDDQPDDPRHHRVLHPHQHPQPLGDHGGPRRQPLVHRERRCQREPDRRDQPDDRRHHRVPHPHRRKLATHRDHGGPRRQPLVHRVWQQPRSG